MDITPGTPLPDFALPDQDKNIVASESLAGGKALVVFIPFPFTGICESELCTIRDQRAELSGLDATVIAITCDTVPSNKKWSDMNDFGFPVLSDYWPHGEVAKRFGVFNDALGVANRHTFVVDEAGIIRQVIFTDSLGTAREFDAYRDALAAL